MKVYALFISAIRRQKGSSAVRCCPLRVRCGTIRSELEPRSELQLAGAVQRSGGGADAPEGRRWNEAAIGVSRTRSHRSSRCVSVCRGVHTADDGAVEGVEGVHHEVEL